MADPHPFAPLEVLVALGEAATEAHHEDAFSLIFDIVCEGRQHGDLSECDALLRWMAQPEIMRKSPMGLIITCVRLTFELRGLLSSWETARNAMREELERRQEDVATFMCGLD